MKTKEILEKYQKQVAALFGRTKPEEVSFQIEVPVQVDDKGTMRLQWVPILDFVYVKPEDKIQQTWELGRYKVLIGKQVASSFELYQMPHCCGIAVSCRSFVEPAFRGKGLATLLNVLRQDIARQLGFSLLMCTDVAQNEPQRRLLKTNGWRDLIHFVNRRTGNTVHVCVIGL